MPAPVHHSLVNHYLSLARFYRSVRQSLVHSLVPARPSLIFALMFVVLSFVPVPRALGLSCACVAGSLSRSLVSLARVHNSIGSCPHRALVRCLHV